MLYGASASVDVGVAEYLRCVDGIAMSFKCFSRMTVFSFEYTSGWSTVTTVERPGVTPCGMRIGYNAGMSQPGSRIPNSVVYTVFGLIVAIGSIGSIVGITSYINRLNRAPFVTKFFSTTDGLYVHAKIVDGSTAKFFALQLKGSKTSYQVGTSNGNHISWNSPINNDSCEIPPNDLLSYQHFLPDTCAIVDGEFEGSRKAFRIIFKDGNSPARVNSRLIFKTKGKQKDHYTSPLAGESDDTELEFFKIERIPLSVDDLTAQIEQTSSDLELYQSTR